MARNHNGRALSAMIAAAVALGLGAALAADRPTGIPSEKVEGKKVEGNWCDADQGCVHGSALYAVSVEDSKITIHYRDTEFSIFEGTIEKEKQVNVEWTIKGTIKGPDKDDGERQLVATVSKRDGSITESKIEGILVKKSILPFEGTLEGAAMAMKEGIQGDIKGNVTGKVKIPGGENVKGLFEGRLTKSEEEKWSISGFYTPPPAKCSGVGGRYRTQEQIEKQKIRLGSKSEGRDYAEASDAPPRAEAVSHGKFVRRVGGTMTGDYRRITLDLPALPVLDHKCSVKKEIPAEPLKLEQFPVDVGHHPYPAWRK